MSETTATDMETSGTVRLTPLSEYEGSLSSRVYMSLKDAILTLAYEPGEVLRKAEICEQLGISRSPVSEAVARLAAEGLLRVMPQSGTYVAQLSMDEVREGAFIREAFELAAVEYVAQIITDEQITLLRRNLKVQQGLVEDQDIQGFYKADTALHNLIMGFTDFKRLASIAETSWLHVNRARQLVLPNPRRVSDTLDEHTTIVDALAARDPNAARAATEFHLGQLVRHLEAVERDRPELFSRS
ncbi:GntR family transcriptional regulator [Roseibium sp.]|uniref:GntR family transcriptional regulator n=1 Tax=Roseibium sp. TaxID=1936156 RepID=UPI003B50E9F8